MTLTISQFVHWDINSAFHLCGKTDDNFPPDGTVRMEKTVVPLWNQMERFFPLVILGNKPRISRGMVRDCDRGKWFSNNSGHSGKNGKRGLRLKLFPFFRKISIGKDCSICCPTRTTGFSIQMESAQTQHYQPSTPQIWQAGFCLQSVCFCTLG